MARKSRRLTLPAVQEILTVSEVYRQGNGLWRVVYPLGAHYFLSWDGLTAHIAAEAIRERLVRGYL